MPSWKSIVTRVGDVLDKLTGGVVGDGIDAVGTGLNTLRGIVTTIIDTGANVLSGILQVAASVVTSIADTGANLIAGALQIGASVVQSAIDVGGNVLGGLLQIAGSIVSGVTDIGGNIISGILQVAGALASAIADAIGNALQGALQVTGAFGQFIADMIGNLLSGMLQVAASLGGFIADGAFGIVHAVTDLGGTIAGLGKSVENIGQDVAEKGIDAALAKKSELIELLLGLDLPIDLAAKIAEEITRPGRGLDLLKWAGQNAPDAGKKAFSEIFDHTVGWGQVTPEEAPAFALGLLTLQTAIGSALHAVAVAKDMVPLLDNTGTSTLSAFLGKFTGWEPTIAALFDPVVKSGIGRPMEQLINSRTLTNLPGESVLSELLSRRDIDESVYDERLSQHGYVPFWKQVFNSSSFRPARIFELVRIMQFTDIDDADLDHLLNFASYPDRTIEILKPVLKAVALSRSTSRILTEATEAFQKGFIDAGQYGAALTVANVKPTEQGLWQLAATAAYNNEVKTELVSAWRSAAARDALSDDELRASLSVIGVTGGKQDIEVLRAQAARLRKAVDDTAAAEKKAINQARATFATAYRTQFKKGLIDAPALAAALSAIGYADIQVQAFVELAQAEVAPAAAGGGADTPEAVSRRVRADLEQAYVLQFQHDLIDAGTLRGALVGIGVNDFEAASIVAREQARKTPSPSQIADRTAERVAAAVLSSLKSAYATQFQDGRISADDLEASLVSAGMDVDAAHAFRLLQEALSFRPDAAGLSAEQKLHARQLEAARKAAAVAEFRAGLIDAAVLQNDLVAAGIFADVAAAIVEEETARAAGQLAAAAETAAERHARELLTADTAADVQAFRSDVIDEAQLGDALVAAGVAPDVAAAIVAREVFRKIKPAVVSTGP